MLCLSSPYARDPLRMAEPPDLHVGNVPGNSFRRLGGRGADGSLTRCLHFAWPPWHMLYFDLIRASVGETWGLRFSEHAMPPLQCRGIRRVEGLAAGSDDDALEFFISLHGLFKTKAERCNELSGGTLLPVLGLLHAAVCTVPARLI